MTMRTKIGDAIFTFLDFGLPKLVGAIQMALYRVLYPDIEIGKNFRLMGRCLLRVRLGGKLSIGEDCFIISSHARSRISQHCPAKILVAPGASVTIGCNASFNNVVIVSMQKITIGDHCLLAPNVTIIDSDFHAVWPPEKRFVHPCPPECSKPVNIGRYVWVGMNSIILKGVSIGENSVIGAGSVVTRDIPANVLAGGNPAKVIRKLNSEDNRREVQDG